MRTARAGVLFPRPSGLAERQTTHPSTSGLDGCKRTVHEGAKGQSESGVPRLTPRRAPRLCRVGRGRDSQETAAQSSVFLPAG